MKFSVRSAKTAFTLGLLLFCITAGSVLASGRTTKKRHHRKRAAQPPPVTAPVSPAFGDSAAPEVAADDPLAPRLARYRVVKMPFDATGLSPRERNEVEQLVQASRYLEDIFWRQNDPEGLALYESLAGSASPHDKVLRHFLMVNGGRFDLVDENAPFVGAQPLPPGRGLYPAGLTRAAIDSYVKDHPEKKAEIFSPYTVVRRNGDVLQGLPYHVAYKDFLQPAAAALRRAAALSPDRQFAAFLELRAAALLTDDYYQSDLAWMDLKNPKIDVIFAPYETYLDGLLGIKTSYGAAVLIRNEAESKKLEAFQRYVADIQDALPIDAAGRPSKRGLITPMEVMDSPFRAGDLRHGYQAVADNLPNDSRIHELKGSKKIFFKNFMDARVNFVVLPIARRLMEPAQAARASGEGYLAVVMMHEISHGLGPAYAHTAANSKMDIREAIGPAFSGLEEAKADVVGMFALRWLVDHHVLPAERLQEYYSSYIAGIFRTVRFGAEEAHGRAEMMEFNFLADSGAVRLNGDAGRYEIDYEILPKAIHILARELLEMEATGDRVRVQSWFSRYGSVPATLKGALDQVKDIPVDIDPIASFPENLQ